MACRRLVVHVWHEVARNLLRHISGRCVVREVGTTERYQARRCSCWIGQHMVVLQHQAWPAGGVQHRAIEGAAPGSECALRVGKRTWLTLQHGRHRCLGVAHTEDDQRFREHPQPEASRAAEARVCAYPGAVWCHTRCPGSRTLVHALVERSRQRVHVKAGSRTPISPEEPQEVVVQLSQPWGFPALQGVGGPGWKQFVWLAHIQTTATQ